MPSDPMEGTSDDDYTRKAILLLGKAVKQLCYGQTTTASMTADEAIEAALKIETPKGGFEVD